MLKKSTFLLFLLALTTFTYAQSVNGTIEHDGMTRSYTLHVPTSIQAGVDYPFVYNLHGYGSSAFEQSLYTNMNETANQNGFFVCYPNGIDNSWNVGFAGTSDADDVSFLNALADSIIQNYPINQDRLYSCGMSNGGFMSYKLACESGDKYAAIASVTGAIVPAALNECSPSRNIPVMQIHGTADDVVPYNGQAALNVSIDALVEYWRSENGCTAVADTIEVENINTDDATTAKRIQYTDCEDDTEVVFYKIDGGGHTWPDALLNTGVTNRDFNANQEIWNFFNRFDLNGSIVSSNENMTELAPIQLFPNPVSNEFTLNNLPSDTQELTIMDALGKVVFQLNTSFNTTQSINSENLAKGLYFVTIEGKNAYDVVKFVKQ